MKLLDLTGRQFGKLTAVKRVGSKNNIPLWECKCECGNTCFVTSKLLRSGGTTSCGCYRKENSRKMLSEIVTTHGKSRTRIYTIWRSMLSRCSNPANKAYSYYGGKGITVCKEWSTFDNFYQWAMQNGYADTLTIDRINGDGNYQPDNCRWVTRAEQNKNRHFRRDEK